MPAVVLCIVAVVVMVVESSLLALFSIDRWTLQTPLIVTIYLGLDRDFVSGGLILVALFFVVEWLVGAPFGIYSLGLAVVFLALRLLRPSLQRVWGVARGMSAGVAALLHAVVLLFALFFVGESSSRMSGAIIWQMWGGALIVAFGSVAAGKAFARLDEMMDPRNSSTGLEH